MPIQKMFNWYCVLSNGPISQTIKNSLRHWRIGISLNASIKWTTYVVLASVWFVITRATCMHILWNIVTKAVKALVNENGIFQENWVSIIAADMMAYYVAMPSTAVTHRTMPSFSVDHNWLYCVVSNSNNYEECKSIFVSSTQWRSKCYTSFVSKNCY